MTDKEMCINLRCLTGLGINQIDSFINNIINVIIHSVMDDVSERTDGKLNHIDIELPYVGLLNADIDDNGYFYNIKLELCDELSEKFKKAITDFESPLINNACDALGKIMSEKYKSYF